MVMVSLAHNRLCLRWPYIDRSYEHVLCLSQASQGFSIDRRRFVENSERLGKSIPSILAERVVLTPAGNVMSKNAASWISVLAGFISSALALRVAFDLGLPNSLDVPGSDLHMQSVRADVAAVAALISVIAHVIDRASK
jgi:hypothetical protein